MADKSTSSLLAELKNRVGGVWGSYGVPRPSASRRAPPPPAQAPPPPVPDPPTGPAPARPGHAPGPSITYDGQEGLRAGACGSAPSPRRLADVRPGVRGRRGADGELSPKAVGPAGDGHPVSPPGHTQLLCRPVRRDASGDGCEPGRGSVMSAPAEPAAAAPAGAHGGSNRGPRDQPGCVSLVLAATPRPPRRP